MSECPICQQIDTCQIDDLLICCKNTPRDKRVPGYRVVHEGVRGGWVWEPHTEPDLFDQFEQGFEELNLYAKRLLEIKDLEKRKFYSKKLAYKLRIDLGAVEAAIQREKSIQRSKESVFVTVKELFEEPEQEVKMLIPEVLPRGDLMVLSGKPGDGKSLMAYEIAYQVLTGGMFAGNHIKKGRVLFIQLDERKGTYKRRIESRGIDTESEDFYLMRRFRLSDLSLLEEKLNEFRPDLIVLDNFRKAISGMGLDENKPEAADTLDPFIELLEDYDASCVLIHHDNKNTQAQGQDRMSGSTNLISKAFSGFRIIRTSENPMNTKIYMQSVKMRDGEPKKFEFNFERGENWYYSFLGEQDRNDQDLSMIERAVAVIRLNTQPALNKYEFTSGQIRELLRMHDTDKTIYTVLDRAEAKCLIRKRVEGSGRSKRVYYRLYDSPISNDGKSTALSYESNYPVDSNPKTPNPNETKVFSESTSESTLGLQNADPSSNVIQITDHPRFDSTPNNPVDQPCRLTEPLVGIDSTFESLSQQQNNTHTHQEPSTDASPWGKAYSNIGSSPLNEVDIGGVKVKIGDKVTWRSPPSKWSRIQYFEVQKLSQDKARVYPGQIDILLSEIEPYIPRSG
jgi:KaiC/GvpD/RAD55 family RecA-like ATPase